MISNCLCSSTSYCAFDYYCVLHSPWAVKESKQCSLRNVHLDLSEKNKMRDWRHAIKIREVMKRRKPKLKCVWVRVVWHCHSLIRSMWSISVQVRVWENAYTWHGRYWSWKCLLCLCVWSICVWCYRIVIEVSCGCNRWK